MTDGPTSAASAVAGISARLARPFDPAELRRPWAGAPASGLPLALEVVILFPWNPASERFAGERIWFDGAAIQRQVGRAASG